MDHADLKVNDFRKALIFTLKWEGQDGKVTNDPKDPGGCTKWGISKRAYPDEDIANLTRERACEIYTDDYWYAAGCNDLSYPTNVVVFDSAVNCGVGRTKGWVEKTLDPFELLELRKQYYIDIVNKNPVLARFARGWWNRLADLKKYISTTTATT